MKDSNDSDTPDGFTPGEWASVSPADRLRLYLNGEMAMDPPENFRGEDPRRTPPYSGMLIDPATLPPALQRMLVEADPRLAGAPWSDQWEAGDPDCPRHYRAPDDGGLTIGEVDEFCSGAAQWYEIGNGLEVALLYDGEIGFRIELV